MEHCVVYTLTRAHATLQIVATGDHGSGPGGSLQVLLQRRPGILKQSSHRLKTFPNTQTNDTSVSGSLAERRPNPYSRSQTLLRGTWFAVRVARWQRGVFTTRHRASWTCILEVQGMNPTHPRTPTLSHSQKLHTDNNTETHTYTRVYTTRHALPP